MQLLSHVFRSCSKQHRPYFPLRHVRLLSGIDDNRNHNGRKPRKFVRQDSETLRLDSVEFESFSDPTVLTESLQAAQRKITEERVPWFLKNMPMSYNRLVDPDTKLSHLVTIVGVPDLDEIPEIVTKGNEESISIISSGTFPGQLEQQLRKLPAGKPLSGLNVFTSLDKRISINMFNFSDLHERTRLSDIHPPYELEQYIEDLMAGKYLHDNSHAKPAPHFESTEVKRFLSRCEPGFVERSSPRRFCKQMAMYYDLLSRGTDEVAIDIETNWGGNKQIMITLALTNVLAKQVLLRVCPHLESKSLVIERSHLDIIDFPQSANARIENERDSDTVAMLRMLVAPSNQEMSGEEWLHFQSKINDDLIRELPPISKWMDERVLTLAGEQGISPLDAEIIVALLDIVHSIKAPEDQYGFSRSNLASVANRPEIQSILELFKNRFDPRSDHLERDKNYFVKRIEELKGAIDDEVEMELHRKVLHEMLNIIGATKRTNAFVEGRFALGFCIDPSVCMNSDDPLRKEIPYGLYYVNGRRFTGFHLRFRDIARGGLRVVTPATEEMFTIESARQLNEVYDLAFAQQLKNKDIPEGGSKAVCLVNMRGIDLKKDKNHVIRKCVIAFVNSLLDLVTPEDETKAQIVDYLNKEELLYLGPDEQITPEHINWIVKRASERQYPMPSAFMSSKPDAGINHKEYGVTSEGVAVFLDEALKSFSINTLQPFTVKLTGGPDGDVAGNMLNILYRNYNENCRVVGIADGTGSVEDPTGIAWEELLRLFKKELPLSEIRRENLSFNAKVYTIDSHEGLYMRNTMHNRVISQAFIPAGGRPATINDSNWEKYLTKNEKGEVVGSSQLIVEGANLFLTPGARENLSKYGGCVIVKDSSANKCGVICSSCEILASMVLNSEEFLEIKPEFVKEVIDRLRYLARQEARLLFRQYRKDPTCPLPPFSERISSSINRASDKVEAYLREKDQDDIYKMLTLVSHAIPTSLLRKASWSKFEDKVPLTYIRNLISVVLGSEIVYHEGVEYVDSIGDERLGILALEYSRESKFMEGLANKILRNEELAPEEGRILANVLYKGGARTAIEHLNLDEEKEN